MRRIFGALSVIIFFAANSLHGADTGTPGQNTHRMAGIGVLLVNDEGHSTHIHHYILIRSLQDDSPAMKTGLKPGDEIVAIDNFPVAGLSLKDAVNTRLRGEQDSVVQVSIKRPGEAKVLTFTLVRKILPVENVVKAGAPRLS